MAPAQHLLPPAQPNQQEKITKVKTSHNSWNNNNSNSYNNNVRAHKRRDLRQNLAAVRAPPQPVLGRRCNVGPVNQVLAVTRSPHTTVTAAAGSWRGRCCWRRTSSRSIMSTRSWRIRPSHRISFLVGSAVSCSLGILMWKRIYSGYIVEIEDILVLYVVKGNQSDYLLFYNPVFYFF